MRGLNIDLWTFADEKVCTHVKVLQKSIEEAEEMPSTPTDPFDGLINRTLLKSHFRILRRYLFFIRQSSVS